MSVVINGVTLKNATYNGEKVKKIYYNDGNTNNLIYTADDGIYFNNGLTWLNFNMLTSNDSITDNSIYNSSGHVRLVTYGFTSAEPVDLTDRTTLYFTFSTVGYGNKPSTSSAGYLAVGVGTTNDAFTQKYQTWKGDDGGYSATNITYSVDVSSLTGYHYILFRIYAGSTSGQTWYTCTKIWAT